MSRWYDQIPFYVEDWIQMTGTVVGKEREEFRGRDLGGLAYERYLLVDKLHSVSKMAKKDHHKEEIVGKASTHGWHHHSGGKKLAMVASMFGVAFLDPKDCGMKVVCLDCRRRKADKQPVMRIPNAPASILGGCKLLGRETLDSWTPHAKTTQSQRV